MVQRLANTTHYTNYSAHCVENFITVFAIRIMFPLLVFILVCYFCNVEAFSLGCGCSTCCSSTSYGYGRNYVPSYPSLSSYPPGQITGYILRAVAPAAPRGYVTSSDYNRGVPVLRREQGQIGYLKTPNGIIPNGPFYWQSEVGGPYEKVSVGGVGL